MSDLADLAAEAEQRFLEGVLERQAHRPRGVCASHCLECGDEIPRARRDAVPDAARCVDCQAFAERFEQQKRANR